MPRPAPSDLDLVASAFLRDHGDDIPAEPSRQKFSLNGKCGMAASTHVPVSAFLKKAQPIRNVDPRRVCADCAGPISKVSGQRCMACYQAATRRGFLAMVGVDDGDVAAVEQMVYRTYGWEGRDHMRGPVPIVHPATEAEPDQPEAPVPPLVKAFREALMSPDPPEAMRKALADFGYADRIPVHKPPEKYVGLWKLEEIIAKPGIEKHLIPLLHFRGRADLGRVHRQWNLLCSMHEHEVETIGQGLGRLQLNPLAPHLCEPPNRVQHLSFYGFLSRLQARPRVAALRPGILDYARSLMPRPFILHEVGEVARRQRHAWWRTFESRMPAWRAVQAERRTERLEAKILERVAKGYDRAAARLNREAIIRRQREEARLERTRRQSERERAAREPKKFELKPLRSAPMAYPYLVHEASRPEHELLALINRAVPAGIDPDLRADICQDLAVGVLCGDFPKDDLNLPVREVIKAVRRMYPGKYGPLSLDAIMPGTDGFRLIDTLSEEDGLWART